MTPEEATSYLDTATENGLRAELNLPYMLDGKDMQDALETIAGMEYEYALQVKEAGEWKYVFLDDGIYGASEEPFGETWHPTEAKAERAAIGLPPHRTEVFRVVHRLVGKTEEA